MNKELLPEALSTLEELADAEQSPSLSLIRLRRLLEHIYKALLVDCGQSFNGLFARMQFFHDEDDTPKAIVRNLNRLRIVANKAAHEEEAMITAEQAMAGIKVIYNFIKYLDAEITSEILDAILDEVKDFPPPPKSEKRSFHAVIKDFRHHIAAGKIAGLEITAIDEEERELQILLRDDRFNRDKARYSTLLPSLWKYANIACHDLTEVRGRNNYYADNPNTIVVLEPDFLVDASAIAECFTFRESFPELFVLSRLVSEGGSDKMLLGRMVNNIFDDLMQDEESDYLELFKRGLATMPIPMVAQGAQVAMDIYKQIEELHLKNVQEYCESVHRRSYLLEPSFLCPAYGLQGRLDLIYQNKNKYSIVELKSGSYPLKDVWPPHRFQVVAYNMILRAAYGRQSIASSSIFYSAAQEDSIRNIHSMPLLEQNLIHARNRIVGILRLLSLEPARFLDWLIKQKPDKYGGFNAAKLRKLQGLLKSLSEHEYEWLCEQIRRVVREIWQVKTGSSIGDYDHGHSALWKLSPSEKEGKLIPHLAIDSSDGNFIFLKSEKPLPITDFRVGDIVILYDENKGVDRQEIVRGSIAEFGVDAITLKVRGGIKRKFEEGSEWAIEHDVLESFLYSPLASLISFLEAKPERRELLLGLREPVADEVNQSSQDEKDSVLQRMKAAKELFIVQGPPGTGKTSGLIGSYIEDFYRDTRKVMLVLSFTNRAVDEICACLQRRGVPFIRTGNSRNITSELLHNMIRGKRYKEIEEILKQNRIFIASVQSANSWYQDLLRIIKIDEIIVDEASQILESQILGILNACEKCIFIGDQNQLPAITVQDNLRYGFEHHMLKELCYDDTNQSLMGRLYRVYQARGWTRHIHMLKGHYRMHEEIAGLIAHYYDHLLEAKRPEQKSTLTPADLPSPFDKRLLWIDCPPSQEDYFDPVMSDAIVRLVSKLSELGILQEPEKELGIVAPYRIMIHAIRKELGEITVDTVERFQGSERDIMILAFPLKSGRGLRSLQSLSSDEMVDRKLNVALSRAKERLIIMANSEICLDSIHYKNLFEHIEKTGTIIKLEELKL